jgi:hypothetical protein
MDKMVIWMGLIFVAVIGVIVWALNQANKAQVALAGSRGTTVTASVGGDYFSASGI